MFIRFFKNSESQTSFSTVVNRLISPVVFEISYNFRSGGHACKRATDCLCQAEIIKIPYKVSVVFSLVFSLTG